MIDSIQIAGIATYGKCPEIMDSLAKINFIYGSNGSGKTTISNVIADQDAFPSCRVNWQGGTRLEPMVYNQDFIEHNFNEPAELKGIFTLGEQNVDAQKKIDAAKNERDELLKEIESLNKSLKGTDGAGGKQADLSALDSIFKERCWEQKLKYDPKLMGAFRGVRNSKDMFRDRVLQELASNSSTLESLTDLEKRAKSVFGPIQTIEAPHEMIKTDVILALEANTILEKSIIGKEDVDIAAMILKLGNSDWVKEGKKFLTLSENRCPFCQQSTPEDLVKSLDEYFDETFEKDSKEIEELETNYKIEIERLLRQIEAIVAAPSQFLDVDKLKRERDLLKAKTGANIQWIAAKKKEPSRKVSLSSIENDLVAINAIIEAANVQIAPHNMMVANREKERQKLTAQVWKYLLEVELKTTLAECQKAQAGLNKAIASLRSKIASAEIAQKEKVAEIASLETEITSIEPTIRDINISLKSFGFQSFSIAKADCTTCYKLVRADGRDAKKTLSEGEKSFVTFLYFYHLLKGSISASGMTTDRVVVFDDPVSSLDSDILFIISSLIKGIFQDILNGKGQLKQIFVLTHNVFFHKEVTYGLDKKTEKDRKFWIVRKSGLESKLTPYDTNPIKTSYELLWLEVRRGDHKNPAIQNTLRRILEFYFTILGNHQKLDEVCSKFEGKERLICRSLIDWMHAGSHCLYDDLYIAMDDHPLEMYLKIFRAIFDIQGHIDHYKMMMGDDYVEAEPAYSKLISGEVDVSELNIAIPEEGDGA
ncbi:MAG: AAA family ATPase [Negativicutes bacterium]